MATSGMKFTHSAHIMPKLKPEAARPATWAMLSAGLAIGFMGMYFSVTRPMSQRMQMVESNLSLMQTEMHQLVGTRDDLWKTNDLLTGLRQQQRQLVEAEQSLVAVRHMKNEVLSLAGNYQTAMQTIEEMETLQTALIDNQSRMPQTHEAIASMTMLQKSVVKLGSSAQARQTEIAAATKTVSQMEKLTSRMISQKETVAAADAVIDSVNAMASSLTKQEKALSHSKTIVDQMATLHGNLAKQGELMPASEATVQKMVAFEMKLANSNQEVAIKAASNLKELIQFQEDLSVGGEQITAAIQTIELLEGFQSEIAIQTGALSKMRRDLMEITFLESTVKQTLQVLKPLIQLSDLRRMNDAEIREAARVILDRRMVDSRSNKEQAPTKVARKNIDSPKITPGTALTEEQVVPTPSDIK